MMDAAGYSGTPLAQKLGLKDGQRVLFLDLPQNLADLATARQFASVERTGWDMLDATDPVDLIHGFTAVRATLERYAETLRRAIVPAGAVWISWPKRAAQLATDITEDVIRAVLLPTGLVDVKVCAVDSTWSGLKLVIRRELR